MHLEYSFDAKLIIILAGYEVRQGKHLSFRAPEQKNFTYMKSLGSYYSEENVRIRLATLANAALIQCQQLGYQVPDDVSIIGFDDLPIAAYTSPPLTTINKIVLNWEKVDSLRYPVFLMAFQSVHFYCIHS